MYHYRIKTKLPKRRWPLFLAVAGLVFLVGGVIIFILQNLKSNTVVTQAAPVIRKVTATSVPVKAFEEPGFHIELPDDWKLISHLDSPYNLYHFQGTAKANTSRILEVYQDIIPTNFMVNRVQPIEANGEHVTLVGNVSENCADFTKGPPAAGQRGTPAKWNGIDFLCDLNNPLRNVVGTSAIGGINKISLKSSGGQEHLFFFAYTDNSIAPDYTTFYTALSSFASK